MIHRAIKRRLFCCALLSFVFGISFFFICFCVCNVIRNRLENRIFLLFLFSRHSSLLQLQQHHVYRQRQSFWLRKVIKNVFPPHGNHFGGTFIADQSATVADDERICKHHTLFDWDQSNVMLSSISFFTYTSPIDPSNLMNSAPQQSTALTYKRN